MKSNVWQDRVCLVTGASSGLGAAITSSLARRRARVVAVGRNAERLQQTAQSLANAGGTVQAVSADVTVQADLDQLRQRIVDDYGQLDMLCNCVGKSTRAAVLGTSAEDFQDLWEANFLSAVRCTRTFADLLIKTEGHVVNIGSLASKLAPRYLGGYPASKFALAAYSQQLRLELGPEGLHVLLVCPGPIKRSDTAPRYADQAADLPADANKPAAGAKLSGIDPQRLAEQILAACESRKPELVVPGRVRLLVALGQMFPSLGDWLLLKFTA